VAIDIYAGGKKEGHQIWMNAQADTVSFSVTTRPDVVNVDGDKVLLAQKTDHKTLSECVFQYFHAPLYLTVMKPLIRQRRTLVIPALKKY
jgi:aminopeptidase N